MFRLFSFSRLHFFAAAICCLACFTLEGQPFVNPPPNITVCSGQGVAINFSGTPGATFNWFNNNTAIGLAASGSGNINFSAANVSSPAVANVIVIPQLGGVDGPAVQFTITVNPIPVVDFVPFIWSCVGEQVDVIFTGTPGATFVWTNNNTDVGLPASGTGDIHFVATNVGFTQNAFITVTPTMGGCTGTSFELPITVTDYPIMTPMPDQFFCAGEEVELFPPPTIPSGPGWQLFWTWTNDNTAIGWPSSGYGKIEGIAADVTSQEIATITYSVEMFGCASAPSSYQISVAPIPEVNPIDDISVCEGTLVNVKFTSPSSPSFSWTNSNKLIGLGSAGTGNINFTTASLDVTETGVISVTPIELGCEGEPETFSITVDPLSTVTQPDNVVVCAGEPIYVVFAGMPMGVDFNWTNTNPFIGLPPSGTGSYISFEAANVQVKLVAYVTVTPFIGSCNGPSKTFTITVNPIPKVNSLPDISVCNGGAVNIVFSGTSNPTYGWTNSNPAIGLADSGTGNISFTTPIVTSQQIGIITVTPTAAGCVGEPKEFQIIVNPIPAVEDPPDLAACAGEAINVTFSGTGSSPTYNWTNSNVAIGLPATGEGDINYVPGVFSTQTATIVVRATENGCIGPPQTFTLAVSPVPVVLSPQANLVACAGAALAINFLVTPGSTVHWTNSNPAIGLPDSGAGFITFNGAQVTNTETATITYTPQIGPCLGTPTNFTITINPIPTVADPPNLTTCGGSPINVPFNGSPDATFSWTNSNPAIGLGASGSGNLDFIAANVSTTQTGFITVTPSIGSCVGVPQTFNIVVTPGTASVNPVANQVVCGGQPIAVNFSGSPGATFFWTNNNSSIGLGASGSGNLNFITSNVSTPQVGTITVTPQIGACSGLPVNFTIAVTPVPVAIITGNQAICSGSGTILTASGGSNFNWSTGQTTASINVVPAATTNYSVTVSNAGICSDNATATVTVNLPSAVTLQQTTCDPSAAGTLIQNLTNQFGCDSVVTTVTSLLPSNVTNLLDFTCNPNGAGIFSQNLNNQFGCDSTVITTVLFDPAAVDTTLLAQTTCDPGSAGTFNELLVNQFGCDSLVVTTVSLLPSNVTNLSDFTCNPSNAGVFFQNLNNQFGCDSTVVTTVLFDPLAADTTLLAQTTCDPAQAGIFQILLSGTDGCDSLVITATSLLPTNTTNLTSTTCDPNAAGIFPQTLTNQFGCDSTVVTTVVLSPTNTTNLTGFTCDPNGAGTFNQLLVNQFGCDSLVVTNVILAPTHVTNLRGFTCNPNYTGVFVQNLTNQFGCDSTVITTVLFDPLAADTTLLAQTTCDPAQVGVAQTLLTGADGCDSLIVAATSLAPTNTTNLFSTTCDPNAVGIFPQTLTNQFGCDSTVVTTISLLPTNTTNLFSTTCDPSAAGVFVQNLTNQFGCDSTVVATVSLLPTNTTNLFSTTCDPSAAGVFVQNLSNQFGCDSTVVATVSLLPTNTTNLTDFTCNPNNVGTFTQTLTNQFGCDSVVITAILYDADAADTTLLAQTTCDPTQAGTSQILLSGTDGCDSLVVTVTSFSAIFVQAKANLPYNFFAISCAGATDGSASVFISGGNPPYQIFWSNGDVGATISGLAAGNYALTVTDQNGCTSVSSVSLNAPLPLQFPLQITPFACGDTLAETAIFSSGGVAPHFLSINGDPIIGNTFLFPDGTHLIELVDANGCSADTSVLVDIPPPPQIALPGDTTALSGQPLTVAATTNLLVWKALEWSPLPDAACADCLEQTWPPQKTQLYTVSITDTFGCTATASMLVLVDENEELYLPNVFSPDDDGTDDVFLLNAGKSVAALEEISIFDRWGNMVYFWDSPVPVNDWAGWDGRARGKKAEVGVYVYFLKIRLANGDIMRKEGDVTIVKR